MIDNLLECRAWDEGNKIMHYNFEFIRSGTEGNDWIIFKSDKQKIEDNKVFDNPYFQKQFKIMRYMGKQDKLSRKMYQMDIVHILAQDENDDIIGQETCVITFERGSFTFAPTLKHRGLNIDELFRRYKAQYLIFEILGNLYQNPELLPKEEDNNEKYCEAVSQS